MGCGMDLCVGWISMSVGSCAILQTVHHISPLKFCLSDLTKEVAILYPDEKKKKKKDIGENTSGIC